MSKEVLKAAGKAAVVSFVSAVCAGFGLSAVLGEQALQLIFKFFGF